MAKMISVIYDNTSKLTPFYPYVEYRQTSRGTGGSILDDDSMFLKNSLGISYEKALQWLQGRADGYDRKECEQALAERISKVKPEVRSRLKTIFSCHIKTAVKI